VQAFVEADAMIGRAPIEGLFYAAGFSGHGFTQSPAVREYLARLVLGSEPTFDLSSFCADRCAGGGPCREHFII
jgi:sarcosine oxidase subunit beta